MDTARWTATRVPREVRNRFRNARLRIRRYRRRRTDRVASIFTYHRITSDPPPTWGPWQYAVSDTTFECHVRRLAARYDVISMDRLLACLDGQARLPANAAVVTVDDGYRDALTRALPVLERHDVPATVYASSSLVGSDRGPLSFRIADALDSNAPGDIDLADCGLDVPDPLPTDRRLAYEALYAVAKFEPPAGREALLDALPPGSGTPMLSWEDLETLAGHELVTVGAHGHHHCPLSVLTQSALRSDVQTAAETLRDRLESPVRHFSYPYGAYDERVLAAVQSTGFETAAGTRMDVVTADDLGGLRFELPRIDGSVSPP